MRTQIEFASRSDCEWEVSVTVIVVQRVSQIADKQVDPGRSLRVLRQTTVASWSDALHGQFAE